MRRAVALAVLTLAAAPSFAFQEAGDGRGDAQGTVAGKKVSVDYGRPSLKGRDMLGQAKAGDQWRLGSNAPTRLETDGTLSFGAVTVPPGKYILKATRGTGDAWTLNVMKGGDAFVDVPLTATALPESVETFTVKVMADEKDKSGGVLSFEWGKTALRAPFKVK